MKILVFAHRLEIGGTQTNAIDLAATLRDRHGFDVVLFAAPGPMLDVVQKRQLRIIAAPDARLHPSPQRMRALRAAVADVKPDLVHAWDWWQALEAYYALHLTSGRPVMVSDMMMDLTRILPKQLPTTFGTPMLRDRATDAGWRRAEVMLPPVDTEFNAAGIVDGRAFRNDWGVEAGGILVVTVSRLAGFKVDPLIRSITAVRRLGREFPLKLVIVGDGPAMPRLDQAAKEVNAELGRPAVVLTGPLLDPRPAYAAADIVIGMGGSSLRGMAFAKPVVVVGSQGFAKAFTLESAGTFYRTGMFGRANRDKGSHCFTEALRNLAEDADARSRLGQFGRDFVLRHHALDVVGTRLASFCHSALADPLPSRRALAKDALRTALLYLKERRFACPSREPLLTRQTS